MAILIRHESPTIIPAIRAVHERAFGQSTEADIVDRLRQNCDVLVSLVAESRPMHPHPSPLPKRERGETTALRSVATGDRARLLPHPNPLPKGEGIGGQVVGHILFSPVTIDGERRTVCGMGLAPMAVLPEYQRQGIGSALVQHGLAAIGQLHCPFVVVLGHPDYYPRFGFEPASRHGLVSQWDGVPDEAFMVVVLDQEAMTGVRGVARYRDEFDAAM